LVGGGSWDGQRADGLFGSIGELRVASGALPSSQWRAAPAAQFPARVALAEPLRRRLTALPAPGFLL
jgi:hypothetical protein